MHVLLFLFCMLYSWLYVKNGRTNLRIIGGTDATTDLSYIVRMETHNATILFKNRVQIVESHVCSGAVLSPTWTLTAAHCIEHMEKHVSTDVSGSNFKIVIRYGSFVASPSTPNTVSDVLSLTKHPAYRHVVPFNNDIGLLHTQTINIPQYAKISALDYSSLVGEELVVAGYGLTNSSGGRIASTLELRKPLQTLNVIAISCANLDNALKVMTPVCIARRCGESATLCPGDSGGPALHPSGIVAITSKGYPFDCVEKADGSRTNIVGILTAVSPFIDWISSHVNNAGAS